MYIDTHCHLNFEAFEDDWMKVAEKAKASGVEKMIVVGTDLKSSLKAVELAEKVDYLYATVGFHPHHCKEFEGDNNVERISQFNEKLKKRLKSLAKSKKVVAIGESGLDYFKYKKTKHENNQITIKQKNLQKQLLGMQIQVAKEINLPMVIHSRESHEDLLDALEHFCLPAQAGKSDGKYPKGVFHCVSGSKNHLKKVLDLGFFVGVDGNVTYNKEVQELAKEIPLNRLVVETDSPFLLPEPFKSNPKLRWTDNGHLRNEPISVKITAEYIARLKKVDLAKIEAVTTKNAEKLFFSCD